jgi:hypothetical protein
MDYYLPCPYCNSNNIFGHRSNDLTIAIKCFDCGATGPIVKFDPDIFINNGRRPSYNEVFKTLTREANIKWNQRIKS